METLNRFKKITNNIIEGVYMIDMKKKIYKALEKFRISPRNYRDSWNIDIQWFEH